MNPFSPSEIALVQNSFRKLNRNADRAAELFYSRLLAFDPSLRSLLAADFADQKRQLIRWLGTIVHRLECFELIRDHVVDVAVRHREINESDECHHFVGAALFWMLEQVLEDDFTPATYAAWMTVFRTLSDDLKTRIRTRELAAC